MGRAREWPAVSGVDYEWVMQVTFMATVLVGAPVVALLSLLADLGSFRAWAEFAIRVGAGVWFLTASAVYLYARFRRSAT